MNEKPFLAWYWIDGYHAYVTGTGSLPYDESPDAIREYAEGMEQARIEWLAEGRTPPITVGTTAILH